MRFVGGSIGFCRTVSTFLATRDCVLIIGAESTFSMEEIRRVTYWASLASIGSINVTDVPLK